MEGQQGRLCNKTGKGFQGRPGRHAFALALHADAVQQDVVLGGRDLLLAQHHLEAVPQVDAQAAAPPVHPQGDGGDGEQAIVVRIQAAGFHVQHDPALLVHWSSGGRSGQPVQQAHRS